LCTLATVPYWQSSVALFEHAVRVTNGNFIAYTQLGSGLLDSGDLRGAERHLRESLRIRPNQAVTELCLGVVLFRAGDCKGALAHYSLALKLKPTDAQVHARLAELFSCASDRRFHEPRKTLEHARLACALSYYKKRDYVAFLAQVYANNGRFPEALDAAQKALALSVGPQETQGTLELITKIRRMEMMRKDGIPLGVSGAK
jgi:Flp pilus assembly protein TadD